MIVQTLDGKTCKWKLDTTDTNNKSGPHLRTRKLLHSTFPTVQILEEVQIEVKKHKYLYLDFYIQIYNLAVEVHGEQHLEYKPFFHKNEYKFVQSQINDNLKKLWCELNNIQLIELYDNEEEETWKKKLNLS